MTVAQGTALPPALHARILVRRGTFALDVELAVGAGEIVALLGPNGAGKSTLLAALSGLLTPESGTVTVSGRTLTARQSAGPRVSVPPERRRVGLLSQEPLLFPHLSALENIAFGQRAQGRPRQDARRDAHEWLEAVGLGEYADRKPPALSGGQQQRVAIARALAARPDVLLLDEPLAALDVQTATQTRRLLGERLAASGTTTILVTHDVLDVVVLADRCAILNDGRIIDDGPKTRVLGHPKNQFIAALAGVNLVFGVADGSDGLTRTDGRMLRGSFESGASVAGGEPVSAVFSPSAIAVRSERAALEADAATANRWTATIESLEPAPGGIRIRTIEDPELLVDVSPSAAVGLDLRTGARIAVSVDPDAVTIRPRA